MTVKRVVIDPHTHFYKCFDPGLFFDGIIKNLESLAGPFYSQDLSIVKAVVLTEGSGYDFYSSFKQRAETAADGRYTVEETGDAEAMLLKERGKPACYIIQGKQIVTTERVEVLTLASSERFSDGISIDTVIKNLIEKRIVTVLPWGFGKWLGSRKKTVLKILAKYRSPQLMLADSSCRPALPGLPAPLEYGLKNEIRIINGSDPFPLESDNRRGGTAGFMLDGEWDDTSPASSLRRLIIDGEQRVTCLGKRDSLAVFLIRQILLKKRAYSLKGK